MNQHITREQAAELIDNLQDYQGELMVAFGRLDVAVGSTVGGPLHEAAWAVFDAFLNHLDKLIGGPESTSLNWFVYDNHWGENGFEHSLPCGTMRAVRSIDDILDVMGY